MFSNTEQGKKWERRTSSSFFIIFLKNITTGQNLAISDSLFQINYKISHFKNRYGGPKILILVFQEQFIYSTCVWLDENFPHGKKLSVVDLEVLGSTLQLDSSEIGIFWVFLVLQLYQVTCILGLQSLLIMKTYSFFLTFVDCISFHWMKQMIPVL
jgi:hypothetical protein